MTVIRLSFLILLSAATLVPEAYAEKITCGAYTEAAESIASGKGNIPEFLIPKPGHGSAYIEGLGRKQYQDLSNLYRNFIQRNPFLSDWFAPLVAAMCIRKGEMGHAFDNIGMVIQECNISPKNKNAFVDRMQCLLESDIVTSDELENLVAEKSNALVRAPK